MYSKFSSIPIVELREGEYNEWLKRAKQLIAYAMKDLSYVPEMIYCKRVKTTIRKRSGLSVAIVISVRCSGIINNAI
ncbi:hypothetical protein CHS0354_023094 [Potamilus streckersoni]|uniref:Uncharacterized protein n=1 Tax=Potamilus streckersoni TaxID=2493646 RepID=A0AAE0W6K1_9BIVA|nr:hypothetical protein CHS0354_023094 [Potamilus streckersoni]